MLNKDGNVYATKPDTQTKLYMDLWKTDFCFLFG
jgi:hypothetical protein